MPVVVAVVVTAAATAAVSAPVAAALTAVGVSAATVAVISTPIAAGIVAAAQGGDLADVGRAAIGAYVAPQVGAKVGGAVASATAGSALQNVAASAAAGAASSATSAAIRGGDIGESALLGALGSAGASIGREVAASTQYDVPAFSEQSRALISQDAPVNLFSGIAADVGSALGRSIVTGDVEGELLGAAGQIASREAESLLRDAYASSRQSEEVQRAEQAISAELEANPQFAEQLRLAEISGGDQPLTTDQKIDALAEAVARDAFSEAVSGGEQVAALPVVAIPVAANAAISAARTAAPLVVRRVAQFAANDPRFAQVMVTNPYTQQLLAAAGLTMSVSLTGDVAINPISLPNESAAESARIARYASEIAKTVPNVNPDNAKQLEQTARQSEIPAQREALVQRQAELQNLSRQGFPVQRELERVTLQLQQPIPMIDVTQPAQVPNIPAQPGTLPPPTIDIRAEPVARPGTTTRPGVAPEARPGEEPATEPAPETAPETAPVIRPGEEALPATRPAAKPAARPVAKLEPAPKMPAGRPGTPSAPVPIEIEDLFTDQDILDFIRETLGEDFATSTREAAGIEAREGGAEGGGTGTATGSVSPTLDIRPGAAGRQREPVSITGRTVATGPGAITGMKEPTFGGDPGQQQDVWNVRSLRLRKALGL